MFENNQKVVKFDVVKVIKTEYNIEIVSWLKERNYTYEVNEIKDLTPYQTKEENNEELSFVSVNHILYHKLTRIAEFLGDDTHGFVEMLLSGAITEFEADPYNLLAFWLDEKDLIKKILKTGD